MTKSVKEFEEITLRRKELVSGPVYSIPDEQMEKIRKRLKERTPKSKKLFDKASEYIPGGVQHMLSIRDPYPFTIKKSLGSRMWDVDDNEYVDFLMMAGPILLGHNYPPLIEKVLQVLQEEGIGSGWTSEWEIRASELIASHMKNVELVRFFQSGTEANMAAVRLARVYTGKKKIIRIGGSYHGWHDEMIYDMHIPYSGVFQAHGIPEEHFSNVLSVAPNDMNALEKAFEEGEQNGGVAAVILEPAGGESGGITANPAFQVRCRELCNHYESLLIFDEVVTGFRWALGGAQEYYGIDADITVMGKVLTHGFPSAGAVGAKKDIMNCFAGLNPGKQKVFVAGTMAGNAISTAASYWAIKFIEETDAINKAIAVAAKLAEGFNELTKQLGLPFFAYHTASLVHFETNSPVAVDIREEGKIMEALKRKKAIDDIAAAMLSEGIITKYGAKAFTCLAHNDEDVSKALEAFGKVFSVISPSSG